jgi:hypothetical protein
MPNEVGAIFTASSILSILSWGTFAPFIPLQA